MAKRQEVLLEDDIDTFVPDADVREEFKVTAMTLHRWDRDEQLIKIGWPPPIYIRDRKYRSRKMLNEFKARFLRQAIENRGKMPEKYERALAVRAANRAKNSSSKRAA